MPSTTSTSPPKKRGYPPMETPNERHRQIIEDRLAGDSLAAIGRRFGVTRQRIDQILGRWEPLYPDLAAIRGHYICKTCGRNFPFGTARRHAREHDVKLGHSMRSIETELKYEAVVDAYQRGVSLDDISLMIRTESGKPASFTVIYRILHVMGVKPNRGGGRYERTEEVRARMRESQFLRRAGGQRKPRGWRASE